ncbi:MAG: transcription termination factor Rho [Chloroflexi bacterium]|nr:transcription termination factor Rho [Chloroflexota bacterium]
MSIDQPVQEPLHNGNDALSKTAADVAVRRDANQSELQPAEQAPASRRSRSRRSRSSNIRASVGNASEADAMTEPPTGSTEETANSKSVAQAAVPPAAVTTSNDIGNVSVGVEEVNDINLAQAGLKHDTIATVAPVDERRDSGSEHASGPGDREPASGEQSRQGHRSQRRDFRDRPANREGRDSGRPNGNRSQQDGRDRDRGNFQGRDSRNGNGGRGRDWQREGSAQSREAAGYRDQTARESQEHDRALDGTTYQRPAEVITRGFVVSVEQGGAQWTLRIHGYLPSASDAVIPNHVVRTYGLRSGDEVVGLVRGPLPGRRLGELLDVQSINGIPFEEMPKRRHFDELTPIYPERQIRLERPDSITARLIDLVAPIGFGQRALIVSPPKAGKTTILKEIGRSINTNYPEVRLIVCLVGERPEEVTDLSKSIKGEAISSTFDEAISHHTDLAELTVERAKRLVESGFDVVVLLDSITRLARAYNLAAPGDSRSLSGGMATSALYPPKRFFGAARALQEGGSLTVIATCLVDTNSRLDDVVYEELKGTGNMELVLDRRLAEERVFPAIDIVKSSTRREELLLPPNELMAVQRLRRVLAMSPDQTSGTQRVVQQMERTRSNAEFLTNLLTQSSGARG